MRASQLYLLWLLGLVAGCDTGEAYAPAAPQCTDHAALDYAPILVRINYTTNYDLDDPQSFYRYVQGDFFDALDRVNPGKYELADGVRPNLILDVTGTNDGYDHFGAYLEAQGNGEGHLFSYSWPTNYVTGERLRADIAAMVDRFVTEGWHDTTCSD